MFKPVIPSYNFNKSFFEVTMQFSPKNLKKIQPTLFLTISILSICTYLSSARLHTTFDPFFLLSWHTPIVMSSRISFFTPPSVHCTGSISSICITIYAHNLSIEKSWFIVATIYHQKILSPKLFQQSEKLPSFSVSAFQLKNCPINRVTNCFFTVYSTDIKI